MIRNQEAAGSNPARSTFTPARPHFESPLTLEVILDLKKKGKAEETINSYSRRLRHLAKNTDINSTEAVKEYITNKESSNANKEAYANAYDHFVKFYGLKWEKPFFAREERLPNVPTTEQVNTIIPTFTRKYTTIFRILRDTGLRPVELHRLRLKNINLEIAITNIVLNRIWTRNWKDYDKFSTKLSCQIIRENPQSKDELVKCIRAFENPFYSLNKITSDTLIEILPLDEMLGTLLKYRGLEPLTFSDIFTETSLISIEDGKKFVVELVKIPEETIQEALVDSLREKNAKNCRSRGKDTVLEVADLEHFVVTVKGNATSFSCVVKGSKSLSGTINWEKIAYQVLKAYNGTHPEHVIVVLARNVADSVTSEVVEYGKSVGNENLVILCDPVELTRFLKARKIIV